MRKQLCHVPGQQVSQRKFQKDLMHIILLTKTTSSHRTKVGVKIREYCRNSQNLKNFYFNMKFSLMTVYVFTITKKLELILNEPEIFFCLYIFPFSWY